MSRKQTPSDFLKQIIGRPVVVKLNSGADYRGAVKTSTTDCMFDILRYYYFIRFAHNIFTK